MLNADLNILRPSLVNPGLLARVVERLGQRAGSPTEIWQRLTENYAVDLDAVAELLPASDPDPVWLRTRD